MTKVVDNRAADPNFLFSQLADRFKKAPATAQQRILAHIRSVSGHNSLPSYHNNGATTEQKLEVYKVCIKALIREDYSELSGDVPSGQAEVAASAEAVSPPANEIPKPVGIRSFKVGVKTHGDKDWACNAMRFATHDEAERYGSDLNSRWMAVEKWEVQEWCPQ